MAIALNNIFARRQLREFYVLPAIGKGVQIGLDNYTSFGQSAGTQHWMALLITLPICVSVYNEFARKAKGTPLNFLCYP